MAAISQKIPNLLGGVSQQPDPVKLPGQVRAAENVYLDPTFGCRKRPGSEFTAELATGIPPEAKWFPIFRDNNERYAVCMYRDTSGFRLRVWDLNTGTERTVTLGSSATTYFSDAEGDDVTNLTIADYTLLSNRNTRVTMSSDESTVTDNEALVVINQVSYNTTYNIDINDAGASPSKVYQASGIEVVPGSYEVKDGGVCSAVGAQNYSVTHATDSSKTGLQFRLVNQCSAHLVGGNYTEYKIQEVRVVNEGSRPTFDNLDVYGDGTLILRGLTSYGRGRSYRVYVKSSKFGFRDNNPRGDHVTLSNGVVIRIVRTTKRIESDAHYRSRYQADAILQNGGTGWRKGDTVQVTLQGKTFTVRVTKERFTYAYNSLGTATFTTPADTSSGALNLSQVTTNLTGDINNLSGFTAENVGPVIKITRSSGGDFNVSTRGGTVNSAMRAIKGFARDISKLPEQGWDGMVLKVSNTEEAEADDYYVKFTTQAPGVPGAGSWEETVAPGIKTNLNTSTMPHALVRQADGTFTLDALTSTSALGGWEGREVGDETSNPEPSFVGRTINDMFFFNNRLGFLSEDAVIMSQPGDYFNFFVNSAIAVSDADPIDMTASSTKPAILKAAVPSPKGLILFAEFSQFLMSSNEIAFSSATIQMKEISNYFYKSKVRPLNSGVSVAFVSESATYSKVMEMAIDSVDNRPVVADITRVIPEYLPNGFEWGEVMPNNNMMVFGDKTPTVYVFKFFNQGDERQLAGWTKWEYPGSVDMFATEDDLSYIILKAGDDKHILVKSELVDDPDEAPIDVGFSKFTPRLDASVAGSTLTTSVEDALNTRIIVPDSILFYEATYNVVVTSGNFRSTFRRVFPEYDSVNNNYYVIVNTDLLTADWVLGVQYTATVTLPSIFTTQEGKADRVNVPTVTLLHLDLYYSGRYEIIIDKLGYDQQQLDADMTRSNVYDADEAPINEISTQTIPVMSRGDIVKTTINALDPFPSAITGYSWEGHYNNRGISPI